MSITCLPSFEKLEKYLISKRDWELIKLLYDFMGEVLNYYEKQMLELVGKIIKND